MKSLDRTAPASEAPASLELQRPMRERILLLFSQNLIVGFLFLSASAASLITLGIFLVLLLNGWEFFSTVSLKEFLFGTEWAPDFLPRRFGSAPLLKGTFHVGLGAALIGIPLGVGTAIYLSEFAGDRTRSILKPAIEILAGIPSIVFGVVALFLMAPLFQEYLGTGLFTAANVSIVLGLMVTPIIATISEDALRAVPRELREAALALGATKWETTRGVVVPAASSGIVAAVLLGYSRAIGETLVVTMAGGLAASMTLSYLEPTETITAYIANRAGGDLPTGSIEYLSLFAIGTVLFVITFAINVAATFALARQRRRFG